MKKEEFEINRLKKKRQLNVQEQIVLRKNYIKSSAEFWRKNGLPKCIQNTLIEKKITVDKIMVFEYNEDYDYDNIIDEFEENESFYIDSLTIITEDKKFIELEVELNKNRTLLIELNFWKDVTEKYEISEHKKGIRKTEDT